VVARSLLYLWQEWRFFRRGELLLRVLVAPLGRDAEYSHSSSNVQCGISISGLSLFVRRRIVLLGAGFICFV